MFHAHGHAHGHEVHAYNFVVSLIHAQASRPHGMRCRALNKRMALNLYLKSPSGFRVLRKYLQLFSKSTLKRNVISVASIHGFCFVIFEAINNNVASTANVKANLSFVVL